MTLWFLWVLFECCVFGWILFSLRSWVWRSLWFFLPMGLAIAFPLSFIYSNYFTYMWPFFLLGCCLRKGGVTGESFSHPAWWLCLLPAAAIYALWQPSWYVYLTPAALTTDAAIASAARLLAGISCGFTFLACVHALMPWLAKYPSLSKLGQCTLGIYIMQEIFFSLYPSQISFPANIPLLPLLASIAITLFCYYLYLALKRNRWIALFLFGEQANTEKRSIGA